MAKKVTIYEVARLSGVSAGTVDRVVHCRGNVSAANRAAVEEAIKKTGYTPNLHVSSLTTKRHYDLAIVIPEVAEGEYWDSIRDGIERALNVYRDFDISAHYYFYNQFNIYSCAEAYEEVAKSNPSAVIIGPTFSDETLEFTNTLTDNGIPYVCVDSVVESTEPVASFCVNQQVCGSLIAKMISQITPGGSEYVICRAERIGNSSANNTIQRKIGFRNYFRDKDKFVKIHNISFSVSNPTDNDKTFRKFFEENPNVRGAVVLSSRGSIVAECLDRLSIEGVRLVCLDLTGSNVRALKRGLIDMLICQRPTYQGYLAVRHIMMNLLYGHVTSQTMYMPLDIVTKENLDFYQEMMEPL